MKTAWNIFLVVVLMAGALAVGFFMGHRAVSPGGAESESDDSIEPTPTVQTAPIRPGRIDRKIAAYGVVTAPSGDVAVLSVAFESRVKKIMVVPGQRLGEETPVIEIEPSADTQLQLLQARSILESATKDLEQTRQRFSDHLATNQDLLQSEQNLAQAKLKLDSLQKAGAGSSVQLKAAGLVAKVDVQAGQVVPAGTALVEIAPGGKLQVRLGIEPSDASDVHIGDSVSLQLIGSDAPAAMGKVQLIAQRINPDTKLADVFISLAPDAAMPLDAYVRGQLTIAGTDGLVVPRSAVLPDEDDLTVFTVDQGKAVKHTVTIVARDDQSAEITGDGLAAGAPVVIVGNMELEDGMSVKTGGGSDESPATQPVTAQSTGEAAK